MDKTYKTIGFVLNRKDWRENDSLFSFYTENFGKIQAVAIGSKKIKSKLMGHLSSYGLVDLMIARSKNSFDKLASARLIEKFDLNLEQDFIYINIIFELLEKSLELEDKNLLEWQLVIDTIRRLEKTSDKNSKKIIVIYFACQLMKLLGYSPELYSCVKCNNKVGEKAYFSWHDNSMICSKCNCEKLKIDENVIKFLRLIFINDQKVFPKLVIKQDLLNKIVVFMKDWLNYLVEKEIYSWKQIV
ncbi:DNA repair protein RecO [Candidatus Falkowbacteria bacterium RIFOXYD2_FULL_35_9]|uniref:DNA repair protein RecO n=1 Tax=Candidatus Falkowbacteria bacterium RIFOXYC2_FULL_36_12 TaxID=1798002 RepID=A0A1F5SWE4_9BACT|nr:MAG: DNA repair protein RecO [Candidatus Falkowbacteria bacterium RIFOXYB2_FULL_35_7]OGF30962.1 MAG: DNA repair protein RecO [Candidatus Falkowbacteria bacterium RIFOXYC2_FULL_36_12]OGF34390.1 MAG: DNA repair protein RecO [Candidatus Falkowbacteria bacterium RIFOXYA2_FULL_35_8]OGF47286.1 MAG: DNA repair protein RecO [Candidatus Falkowbacteria bacterium RIFOXYD2_FULL_35_9]